MKWIQLLLEHTVRSNNILLWLVIDFFLMDNYNLNLKSEFRIEPCPLVSAGKTPFLELFFIYMYIQLWLFAARYLFFTVFIYLFFKRKQMHMELLV